MPALSLKGLVLVTRADVTSIDGLVGRASHDDRDKVGKVQKFFDDWGGLPPYRGDFRSIFVYYEGEHVDPHGSAIKAYGNSFLMNNSTIIPSLEIVCSQDIQNAAVNAIDAPELAHRNYSRFEDLSEMSPNDTAARTDALIRALMRRERPHYVEGRMPRTPVREDILEKLF